MKTILTVGIIIISLASNTTAQELSPHAQKLYELYVQLEGEPDNAVLQHLYLLEFPNTAADFDTLFDAADFSELYDGYPYINMLKTLIPHYPMLTGCILLAIAKDSHWQADAFNYLQRTTAFFALEYSSVFIEIFESFNAEEQDGVITFLAKGAHAPVAGFQNIVEKMISLDKVEIADRFTSIAEKIKDRSGAGN